MSRKGIMLCYPFSKSRLEKWPPPYYLQAKLNGNRCRVEANHEGVSLYTSQGNIFKSVPHINQLLESIIYNPNIAPLASYSQLVLDGELYIHGVPLNKIRSITSRTTGLHPDYSTMEFHIFDVLFKDRPMEQEHRDTLLDRIEDLVHGASSLKVVKRVIRSTKEGIVDFLKECYGEGYEGIVVRNKDGFYETKRSTNIMKLKPRYTDEYRIVGFKEEVAINGDPKGSLGALQLSDMDGKKFWVGTGSFLTRDMRFLLWQDRHKLIGKIAVIKYQELTGARGVPYCPALVEVV